MKGNKDLGALLSGRIFPQMSKVEYDHYTNSSRLGGTYSHLCKTLKEEGDEDVDFGDYEVTVEMPYDTLLDSETYDSIFLKHYDQFVELARRDEELVPMLIDATVWLYHFGVASKCKQACLQLQSQMAAISQLEDAQQRCIKAEETNPEYHKHLKEACAMFRDDVIESVRQCSWYRAMLYFAWKQEAMFSMCVFQARLLLKAAGHAKLFQFVPESYVETLMDSFHALRRGDPLFAPVRSLLGRGLEDVVTFLVMHFNNPLIVNPDVRDVLLQSISVLLQY